jgi:hypothetical protein
VSGERELLTGRYFVPNVESAAAGPQPSPGFADDIRPLFREKDRNSMLKVFDLWSVDDVRRHAESIYGALSRGVMPCDGPWPAANQDLLRRWIDGGARP